MKLLTRYRCFTVVELIVVMLISSIVITILWRGYFFIKQKTVQQIQKSDQYATLIFFDNIIRHDFEVSCGVFVSGESVVIQNYGGSILYTFNNKYILRISKEQTDTMKLAVIDKSMYYYDNNIEGNGNIIEELQLTVKLDAQELNFCYKKKYDAATLINLELETQ